MRCSSPSIFTSLPEYFAKLTLKRVPGVGHFMMREAPDLVVDEVRAFLGGAP